MECDTAIFDDSTVGEVTRYGPGQPPDEEGIVVHGEFTLAGQRFARWTARGPTTLRSPRRPRSSSTVPTGPGSTPFGTNSRRTGRCGWLEDKFGVSWQILPTVLGELLADDDPEKAGRVVAAMLEMEKLDVDVLESASAGE